MRGIASVSLLVSLLICGGARAVDFERDVAPILQTHCLSCHDAATASGGVRLDLAEHALELIQAMQPEDSLLIQAVDGDAPQMPQNASPLSAEQVQVLRDWIAAGAVWPECRVLRDDPVRDLDWWSLRPLQAVVLPDGGRKDDFQPSSLKAGLQRGSLKAGLQRGGGNPVDAFVDAKLAEAGIVPRGEAEPLTLLRRLTFDLTGLPPTPEAVAAFTMKDYQRVVDELLASPEFGEKWAQHWLDVARYGETHGYDKDQPRNSAWPYRDYVIAALNSDKPYDRFVQEQIAGDAIFPGEPDGIAALGFLAAGPWDLIGHIEVGEAKIDGRIAKHLDRDEMIAAVFNVFTSTTVQCAQCHHHKFDPVKTEDYYRLHAVFAAVDRAERIYRGLSPNQEQQRTELLAKSAALQSEQNELEQKLRQAVAEQTSDQQHRIAELKQQAAGPQQPQYGYHSQISREQDATKWVQVDLGSPQVVTELRLVPAFDTVAGIGAGFGFPLRYRIEAAGDAEFSTGIRVLLDATGEDQSNPKDQDVSVTVGGEPLQFIRITATKLAPRSGDFIFALGELQVIGSDPHTNLALGALVTAADSIEALPRWSRNNLVDGIYYRELDDPQALAELRRLEREVAAVEADLRTPDLAGRLEELAQQHGELAKQIAAFPRGEWVYAAATQFDARGQFRSTGGTPRPIHLLHRGDINSPGPLVAPGMTPLWPGAAEEFDLPSGASEADARAALARAITSDDNPLLWRSIVNRLWQWTFGQGLVGTSNDFGRMGMQPTHPELLDYLALRLRDDPQRSLKSIIRLLVTSDAYRRSSEHDEAAAAIDAGNALLWRGKRRRLTAEEFRDSLLSVADRLRIAERGGPSFRDFVVEKPEHSPHYQYHLHSPDDPASHRRSIYRFVVRSQPQPLLTALDCADPSLSVDVRDESTTSLQALTQWNNPLVEAMSRHFGRRIEAASAQAATGDPVNFVCRLALGRAPNRDEHAALSEHLEAHGAASLARVIFNLNAFVYVD